MSFRKINFIAEIKTANQAVSIGMRPCSVCQGRLMPMCMESYLKYYQDAQRRTRQAERRERLIRKAKRVGNLIEFPKIPHPIPLPKT
jgi:hypothetical protein